MNRETLLRKLREYKLRNAEKYGIEQLGIFGSYARGQSHSASDVDIVIKIKTPNPYIMVHIKADLEQDLNLPVDVIRMRDTMNPFLKKQIEKDAVYVQ
ncbi:MAG: nucleotidyltransferase domain-containing protein [Desulfuromonadaceae bacterium]|nr:nucleotidyltransferase domain-containing protein [Desulfuromonadaceae bacterium]